MEQESISRYFAFLITALAASFVFLTAVKIVVVDFFESGSKTSVSDSVSSGPKEAFFYFSPEKGDFKKGENFTLRLKINASGGATSIRSSLDFDPARLSVESINTAEGVFSYWWEKYYSNTDGRIRLQASVPAPGFSGDGLIAEIVFRAGAAGSAAIIHNSTSLVLKPNDKNILNLSRSSPANFNISSLEAVFYHNIGYGF